MNLILIRGLTRESRHWGALAGQSGALARHFADSSKESEGDAALAGQVITLDLPGNGRFAHMRSPLSVESMVNLARLQLQANSIAPPYVLVAMSLGGLVATDWAMRFPEDVQRLILINTSMRPYNAYWQRLQPRNWPALLRLLIMWGHPARAKSIEKLIFRMTCQRTDTREADVAAWTRIRLDAPVGGGNAVRQLWAAARFRCKGEPPGCRTLLLSGSGDKLVDPACSTDLAVQWRAGHYQHPWAGHDLPNDDPEWVGARIAHWLAQK
jgi:pimeloyl-ACP methyl ester carboxylesterase